MYVPFGKTFLSVSKNFILWPWPPTFDLLFRILKLCINFWTERGRAFMLRMDIPYGKTFLSIPNFWSHDLDLQDWLAFEKKTLTLALTFEPKEMWLSYCAWIFLVARPFCQYQIFLSCDIDLQLWPTYEKTFLGSWQVLSIWTFNYDLDIFPSFKVNEVFQLKLKNFYC